jgi:hypothetical protein
MNLLFLVSASEFGALICGIHIDSDTQWPHDMLSAKHFQVMRLQVQADAIRCLFSSNAVQNLSN